MESNGFVRKQKEERPVVAVCYDFDKTLSPDDMQAQGYIQAVGCDIDEFWKESNGLARDNDMDQNLAYMYKMIEKAQGKVIPNRQNLARYGAGVKLFPGVSDWFERMKAYGSTHGVIVEHYIISSGLKEMIEGTELACKGTFEKIYASSFYFNEHGVALWPAQVVNYTNKTQFLFRIEKGVLDINDPDVNKYFPPEQIRVPFRNMVYIGDSDTDIPCMKLVNSRGGYAIGVYDPETSDKKKVYKMIRDERIKFFAPADYRDGSELDVLLKSIIERTAANEKLESWYYQYKNETLEADRLAACDEKSQKQDELISALEESRSFAATHLAIKDLSQYNSWTKVQKESLYRAAVKNGQIRWILKDEDVSSFYLRLMEGTDDVSKNRAIVKECIEKEGDME